MKEIEKGGVIEISSSVTSAYYTYYKIDKVN